MYACILSENITSGSVSRKLNTVHPVPAIWLQNVHVRIHPPEAPKRQD